MLTMYWDIMKCYLRRQEGQGMVEYGLILALIAVVTIGALTLLGGNLKGMFNSAAGEIK